MTQVDFYILSDQARGDRFTLACRLADKAYRAGHRVVINTDNARDLAHLDELLWTFDDQGFVPHDPHESHAVSPAPVLLAKALDNTDEHDVLINLAQQIPDCFSQFERLLEPLDRDEPSRVAGRERYRYYRDCGYPINNHEINR